MAGRWERISDKICHDTIGSYGDLKIYLTLATICLAGKGHLFHSGTELSATTVRYACHRSGLYVECPQDFVLEGSTLSVAIQRS